LLVSMALTGCTAEKLKIMARSTAAMAVNLFVLKSITILSFKSVFQKNHLARYTTSILGKRQAYCMTYSARLERKTTR